MRFSRLLFLLAGWYGLVVLGPMCFLEGYVSRNDPPAITHPEYYYGFLGAALAWQFVFLLIAADPLRYRPLIIPAILEKAGYGIAVVLLLSAGRVSPGPAAGGFIDLILCALFVAAYLVLGRESALN